LSNGNILRPLFALLRELVGYRSTKARPADCARLASLVLRRLVSWIKFKSQHNGALLLVQKPHLGASSLRRNPDDPGVLILSRFAGAGMQSSAASYPYDSVASLTATRGPLHRTPSGGGSITAATSRSAQRPSASFPRRGARCPRRPPPPIRSARRAHTERRPRADGECARAPPALPPSR